MLTEIDIDGARYQIALCSGPFEDGEFVRYERESRTVFVSHDLAPDKRMSLVTGLLLAESQRVAFQRAATGLMSTEVDDLLRDGLGTPRRRGVMGYKLITTPWDLDARFGVSPEFAAPRIVQPANEGLIVLMEGPVSVPVLASWGIEGSGAVADTSPEDDFWSLNVQTHRCLVPATGWFDYVPGKPAMYMLASATLFAFAGVWGHVSGPDGEARLVFTVITTEPGVDGHGGSDSMPVVLAPDEYAHWLDPNCDAPKLIERVRTPWPKHDLIRMELG
jgi:putative SOS response-associated peptidase YedK